MAKLYMYLGKRDKKGIKVLATFQGDPKTARVHDVKGLGLDPVSEATILSQIEENKMNWEVWIEPASSYTELKSNLERRGYRDMPLAASPSISFHQSFDTSKIYQRNTMIQKGS